MAHEEIIRHYRTTGTNPPTDLNYGELAVQYNSSSPKIYIRKADDTIAEFVDKNYIDAHTSGGSGDDVVHLSGDETITGIKTISGETVTILGPQGIYVGGESTEIDLSDGITIFDENSTSGWEKLYYAGLDGVPVSLSSVLHRLTGTTTASTVSNLPTNIHAVLATVSANASLSFSGIPAEGHEVHIIIRNAGTTTITINLPNTGNYVCTTEDILLIEAGKYGEANIITIEGTGFVRGTSSF